jgi:melibiose permease
MSSMFIAQTIFLADVVDYGEVKMGFRAESITFSMKGFLQKMAYTIQAIIMYASFLFTGFEVSDLENTSAPATAEAKSAITFLMFVVPPVMMIVSFIIFSKKYKIHGEFKKEVLTKVSEGEKA